MIYYLTEDDMIIKIGKNNYLRKVSWVDYFSTVSYCSDIRLLFPAMTAPELHNNTYKM